MSSCSDVRWGDGASFTEASENEVLRGAKQCRASLKTSVQPPSPCVACPLLLRRNGRLERR
eukprot:2436269-Lingulodinium_polyedra.AAC.1